MAEPEQQEAPAASKGEQKKYTWEEIRKHNESRSLWIVVHNTVYDVSKFMEEVSWLGRAPSVKVTTNKAGERGVT